MSPYSVPVCPWCGMPSRMHPDTHREWMTAHMNCGSEIYPPGATTPSQQSEACKIIASTTADRDALRAEVEALRHEVELTNEHEHQILTERNEARAELERTKEVLERVRRNHLRRMIYAIDCRLVSLHRFAWQINKSRRVARLLDAARAALERKDGA